VAAEGLSHHNEIVAVSNGLDDDVGVGREAGGIVLDRQVHDHHVVATLTQLGLDEVPIPSHVARAMDEDVGGGRRWPTSRAMTLPGCHEDESSSLEGTPDRQADAVYSRDGRECRNRRHRSVGNTAPSTAP